MAKVRDKLINPPVREALIDIQFNQLLSIEQLDELRKQVSPDFSKASPIWLTQIGMNVQSNGTHHSEASEAVQVGMRFDTEDGNHVLQYRNNGFTFSRLTPYRDWQKFIEKSFMYWRLIIDSIPGLTINRVALRYINELNIPLTMKDFSEYLTCPPEVPRGLPQAVGSFLQRVAIPFESNTTGIVTQALEGTRKDYDETFQVILDVDVFCEKIMSGNDWKSLTDLLELLRQRKNQMFFGYITERMVEEML